jgi:hypothetical protein
MFKNHGPHGEPTNEDRANRIASCIECYANTKGEVVDTDTDVRDMLTDIMHYCDIQGIVFDAELSIATDNYSFEKE